MDKCPWDNRGIGRLAGLLALLVAGAVARPQVTDSAPADPAELVNPLIGTTNGGNDYPGATLPLGMLAWSPEEPRNRARRQVEGVPGSMRDDRGRPAAQGGYEYSANHISGFSLTHLMGTGCAGASGDIPFMPYVGEISSSPADDEDAEIYINGVLALKQSGFISNYDSFPLTPEGKAALKPGKNIIAVHCHQTVGGQYIDFGLVDVQKN